MRCLVILDPQNDFLPKGSFNSKIEYLDVLNEINSIRLRLFNCNEKNLMKSKDCLKIIEREKFSYDENIKKYYKCYNEIDDEKDLDEIFVFPFDNNFIQLNEYNSFHERSEEENIENVHSYNTQYGIKNLSKSSNDSDLDKCQDNMNDKEKKTFNKLKEKPNLSDFSLCIISIDYHPQLHVSFAETHKIIYEQIYSNNLDLNKIEISENLLPPHTKKIQTEEKRNNQMEVLGNSDDNYIKYNQINNLSDIWKNIKNIKNTKEIYKNVNSVKDIKEYKTLEFLNETIDIWPVHCVKNTHGCKVHKKLIRHFNDIIIKKAENENNDSYTIFQNVKSSKNILEILKEKNIKYVYLCGFIFEYCVKETALSFLNHGFETFIIEDATAYLYDKNEEKDNLKKKGIKFIKSCDIFTSLYYA